jgi:integrase
MPKGQRNPIDTLPKREALPSRHEPYWHKLDTPRGVYLGYFKPAGTAAPTWRLRVRLSGKYCWEVLAIALDKIPHRGALDYSAALERARTRAAQLLAGGRVQSASPDAPEEEESREETSGYRYAAAKPTTYTVGDLLLDHAQALSAEGKSTGHSLSSAALGPLFSSIASLPVAEVRGSDLIQWRDHVAASEPLPRHKGGAKLRTFAKDTDPESRRKRRVRVNRLIADLKAARNRIALSVDWLPLESSREFDKLKKYKDVGRGKVRPLDADEVSRLLSACESGEFRDLVLGALVTGARYSELCRLRVADFRRTDGKVHFDQTKDEKERGRDVALSPEGIDLFLRLTKGRPLEAPIFAKRGGGFWGKSEGFRPMNAAVVAADLAPYPHRPTFHNLRDTYATTLLRSGVRLEVVSKLLGHSSVSLTEKHYARFAEDDLDSAARSLPAFVVRPADVAQLSNHRGRARA